ncbi:MAG: ATP-binding protein [Chitinivibrionales bacterium]|nr:ATP-binding protein [Chitinivibrionales bacterium]
MVLVSGPRQSGKTVFAREIAGAEYPNKTYFNYDEFGNKNILLRDPAFFEKLNRIDDSKPLVILDEIHKYHDWKNYLKGVIDGYGHDYMFLITGSGRLESYQRSGDSLAGRYFSFRIWPFTLGELGNNTVSPENFLLHPLSAPLPNNKIASKIWSDLESFSGFPEPFTIGDRLHYSRWTTTYHKQLVYEDLREVLHTTGIDKIALLYSLLPERIGSPLSKNNLAQDLSVSPNTIDSWLGVFEKLFITFSIGPWSRKIQRSIVKEKKLYLFDYAGIQDAGSRFENMVAVELARAISLWNDLGYGAFTLHYLRNKEKKEVDFLIARNNNPVLMLEAKAGATDIPENISLFQGILKVPAVVATGMANIYQKSKNMHGEILLITASDYFANLP